MIGKTISHYKILEKLGEGGMGVVYKAQDTKLDRTVALKFISPQSLKTDEEKTRFIQEAKAAAAINHANITTIYEINDYEKDTFISMEYIEGESLRDKIESGPFKIDESLKIAIQMAEGLQEAHEKGVVHRDIKSANIMITEKGQVKIMDFGLAKLKGQSKLTKDGTTLGTAAYMSPEQAQGKKVDHRTDIWSQGVVLYEMVTGQLPFKGDYEQAVIYSILNEGPEPVTGLRTGVPMDLEKIINKALAKKAEERYQGLVDLLVDLKTFSRKMTSWEPISNLKDKTLKPSIAVLPFRDMSPQKDQDYFCEGIAEEIINSLTQIEKLRVIARTSAFAFKGKNVDARDIGEKLDVKTLLEGSIRKAGNRLRITAQLINVADGSHLWSERYDRDLEDIFAIQDEISLKIVENLKVKLLKKEKTRLLKRYTEDQEAYDLYLKGRYFWNRRYEGGLQKAIEYFNQTIKKDPSHAPAYSGIADSLSILGLFWLPPREVFPRAKSAAQKAIEIDESLVEGHTSLGWILFMYDWDWRAAEREFKRAVELDPRYALNHIWYAIFLSWTGRFEEATVHSNRALELEPGSLIINASFALVLYFKRQYDEAIKQGVKAVEMDPNFLLAYRDLALGYMGKGMWKECIAALEKAVLLSPDSPFLLGMLGNSYAKSGQKFEAHKILSRLKEIAKTKYNSPANEALIFLGLDENDQAFKYLEKAYDERSFIIAGFKFAPFFDSIRPDPRFKALLKKLDKYQSSKTT